jgi:hypothetical protein
MNSEYFDSKLKICSRTERVSAQMKREFKVKDCSYDVFYAFLKYIYTDCIDIETEKALDLLVLANNYKEENLKQKCLDVVKNHITCVCNFYSHSFREKIEAKNLKCTLKPFQLKSLIMRKKFLFLSINEKFHTFLWTNISYLLKVQNFLIFSDR